MSQRIMHIGLDDTDSTRKGCTTYIAALLVEKLEKLGARFVDYPNLIRLNPNVPWKTRGNGALCLRIRYDERVEDEIKHVVLSTVENNADLQFKGTDPGVVFLRRKRIPKEIRDFAKNTITGIETLKEALRLLEKYKGEAIGFKNGRGIIGSLAAIGETLEKDYTYEILAYRIPENYGSKRKVDEASIFRMDIATSPYTFNNVDTDKRRVIITPRGPDPILFGIRGENPEILKKAFPMTNSLEPVERWVIFRSNQGTDAHLKRIRSLRELKPYSSVIVRVHVKDSPHLIRGRHVIFSVKDETGQVDCAAYEPSGNLSRAARELLEGDYIRVYGSVRAPSAKTPATLNVEKIQLLKLAPKILYENPKCPKCDKRMKSMGKRKGFRCERCGFRDSQGAKLKFMAKRELNKGLYVASARSQRHLTKPLMRYGMEKRDGRNVELIEDWHFP